MINSHVTCSVINPGSFFLPASDLNIPTEFGLWLKIEKGEKRSQPPFLSFTLIFCWNCKSSFKPINHGCTPAQRSVASFLIGQFIPEGHNQKSCSVQVSWGKMSASYFALIWPRWVIWNWWNTFQSFILSSKIYFPNFRIWCHRCVNLCGAAYRLIHGKDAVIVLR